MEKFNQDKRNQIFDEIVKSRHSVRAFKDDKPPKKCIGEIIRAGMLAPYAAAAVGGVKDFRRFFVFEKNSSSSETLALLMKNKAEESVQHFESLIAEKPFIKSKVQPFLNRLQMVVDKGVPGVTTAPYFIIVAELRGFPPSEQESLAHVLENMWLKATALDLGFQLVSLTSQMAEDEELMKLLGLPVKKFALNGCAIGYPATIPSVTPRPDIREATQWMD
ncbi:MAG: nitroreductase family protein [Methanobacterium paludis]|nr:nitroreductase family protein [Methanobacterium paludis]